MKGKNIIMFAMALNASLTNATSVAQIDRAISEFINEHQHDAIVESTIVMQED